MRRTNWSDILYSKCGFCPPLLEMNGATCKYSGAFREMFGKLDYFKGNQRTGRVSPAHPLTWASRFTLRLTRSLLRFELKQPGGWRAGPRCTLITIITCDIIQIILIQFIMMYSDKCVSKIIIAINKHWNSTMKWIL